MKKKERKWGLKLTEGVTMQVKPIVYALVRHQVLFRHTDLSIDIPVDIHM